MKCKRLNLDLALLYQETLNRDYMVLGSDEEYWEWKEKYRKEEDELDKFFSEKCDLKKFIYLTVFIFKEKYPNLSRYMYSFCLDSKKNDEKTTEYFNITLTFLEKISSVMWCEELEDELMVGFEDCYYEELNFTFNKVVPIETVELALNGLVYSKMIEGSKVLYDVEDSPISILTVSGDVLNIKINHDKAIFYGL